MERKYFDIHEAEKLLPNISPLVQRAQQLKERIDIHEARVQRRMLTDGSEELALSDLELDSSLTTMREKFYETIEKIEKHGCLVRNIDEGCVDFYTRFEGREVFFCWQVGSKKIKHWHELEENFTARKKILELR